MKKFLNPEGALTRGPLPNAVNQKNASGNQENGRGGNSKKNQATNDKNDGLEQTPEYPEYAELAEKIQDKSRELREMRERERGAKDKEAREGYVERKKIAKLEVFRLERELRAAREGWPEDEPVTGALPDFLVIGVGKGGTTFLYHLLTQHPLVEPAALKEPHFFDNRFGEGVEWYRQNFPTPRRKDGRTTITGEATPFMFWPQGPERAARVVPRARLIALLRNPVDRAYSSYQQMVGRGWANRTFEEVIEEEKALLLGTPQLDGYRREEYLVAADDESISTYPFGKGLIDKGLYVDHLLRWAEHFDREQMLVLKSEDFFGSPQRTLGQAFDFLGLPEWEPDPSVFERKRNSRKYEKMDPETRRSLEEYFEPHNKRLYDYLGRDLGW